MDRCDHIDGWELVYDKKAPIDKVGSRQITAVTCARCRATYGLTKQVFGKDLTEDFVIGDLVDKLNLLKPGSQIAIEYWTLSKKYQYLCGIMKIFIKAYGDLEETQNNATQDQG